MGGLRTPRSRPQARPSAYQTLCDVGPLVSRKAQFVPALSKTLNSGFTCHKERVSSPDYQEAPEDHALEEVLKAGQAQVVVDENQQFKRVNTLQADAAVFGA